MIITNTKELATTQLRKDALEIIEAGYGSIRVSRIFDEQLQISGSELKVAGQSFPIGSFEHIYVIGFGKASAQAALEVERILTPERITSGFVIDIATAPLQKIVSLVGTHPLPSPQNVEATKKIIDLVSQATDRDLVLTIICGGGSSLLCQPDALSVEELQDIGHALLTAGATIQEINTVRKHTSLVQGGSLAKYAYPATVISLIISDVPGDDLSTIASGPTVLDPTTKEEAEQMAAKFGLPHLKLLETPKEPKYFEKVSNVIIASGSRVVDAMAKRATELGYKPNVYSRALSGLANETGPKLASAVQPGEALLACGETEVIVTKPGKGGRNQDVALSGLPHLSESSVIVSAASDGKDNIDVAGAICDGKASRSKAKQLNLDPTPAVTDNRSYQTLKELDDLMYVDKVTANISDFMLALRGPDGN
jgi:glycerate-2-kinase